jgi:hypothetical protein
MAFRIAKFDKSRFFRKVKWRYGKADAGVGGMGYEKRIVFGEIFGGLLETKFVPTLREGDVIKSLPSDLMSQFFVDFRDDGVI